MTVTIAVISGRPADGTLLPKREKYVWAELKRVLRKDMEKFKGKDARFFIPIYNKFDLEVLRICEQLKLPVTYYLPTDDWGTEKLPQHQLDLIARMRTDARVIPGEFNARLTQMIADADMVYVLPKTKGVDHFAADLAHKRFYLFPYEKMTYTTEEEAEAYIQNRITESAPDEEALKKLMDEVEVKHLLT